MCRRSAHDHCFDASGLQPLLQPLGLILVQTTGKEGSIELPNGNLIATAPGEYWTLTNLDDPSKSETVNLTGAFHYTFHENGDVTLVGTGRNLFGFVEDHSLVIAMGFVGVLMQQMVQRKEKDQ